MTVFLGWDYVTEIWVCRVLVWAVPLVVFFAARRVCRDLRDAERIERVAQATMREPERSSGLRTRAEDG